MKFSEKDIDIFLKMLDFSKIEGNLIPIITQDYKSNEVLIMAFANKDAIMKSLSSGYVHYYSRSKKKIWKKGEESGHLQEIYHVFLDCDNDSILFKVKQHGAACHMGYYSCFHKEFIQGKLQVISKIIFQPNEIYKNFSD
jgi:phosphoribosyl-ATP pyrophosphohydrolase/phosphoribosyl-AMP cyclohydrolase